MICFFMIFTVSVNTIASGTLDQFLDRLEKRYSQNSFTADFFQASKLQALDIDETASGKASFSHPGKMIWEYIEPQQHQMITDGKMLWIYRPDQNQVMVGKAANFFKEGSGGVFLSDISIVREKYIISIQEDRKTFFTLKLIPKIKTPEIQSILLFVSKENYNIEKIVTFNIYEDTIEIEFHNIEFKEIKSSAFNFNIPENSNIIDLDSQLEN